MMFPSLIPPWVYVAGALAVASAFGIEELRIAKLSGDLAQEQKERAAESSQRRQLALDHQIRIGKIQSQHAADQQQKDETYAAHIDQLKTAAGRDAADAGRMRLQLTLFTSGARQPGETDAAAGQRALDRLPSVGALLAEGIELEAESRAIIQRRDAEVARLLEQVRIDRAAIEDTTQRP